MNIRTQIILILVMVLLGLNLMVEFKNNEVMDIVGPQEIESVEMERAIDQFQDKYEIPEDEIPEMFRNKDERLWKK